MEQIPTIILSQDGVVDSINDMACAVTGLPGAITIGKPLKDHLTPEFRDRLDEELTALANGDQSRTRLNIAIIGIDAIARFLSLGINRNPDDTLNVEITPDTTRGEHIYFGTSSIADSQNLLPVARRLTTICRRATSQNELLNNAMAVLSEVTSAVCAAVIEWGGAIADWSISATAGNFDRDFLKGIFRSSVIGRLTQGDVVVKDAMPDGSCVNYSLILLPLVASMTPEGVMILYVPGTPVITAVEQHALGLLGEIIGMGVTSLKKISSPTEDFRNTGSDQEATIALGRLSAGLAHEINNAVTILRNNTEQMSINAKRFGTSVDTDMMTSESIRAVETIQGLTGALRAFAPEESSHNEEIDMTRIVEMVVASVRFYAKSGVEISINSDQQGDFRVTCRSHYVIRSLFLIFVELVESALTTGRILMVNISLSRKTNQVNCTLIVSSEPLSFPAILLSQLDRDGVLVRLIERAGATFSYSVNENDLHLTLSLPTPENGFLASRESLPPPNPRPSSLSVIPERRGTILIVDDDEAVIRSTRRILEKEHDVLAASSGKEALNLILSGRKIEVILLDIVMPHMNGRELVETLHRKHPELSHRIIFMTGRSIDMEMGRYLTKTGLPVLQKPLNINLMNLRINEILTAHR
jgi:CheY-like chemotaxis protein